MVTDLVIAPFYHLKDEDSLDLLILLDSSYSRLSGKLLRISATLELFKNCLSHIFI